MSGFEIANLASETSTGRSTTSSADMDLRVFFSCTEDIEMEMIVEEYNSEFPGFVYAATANDYEEANDTAYEGDQSGNKEDSRSEESEDEESTLVAASSTLTTTLPHKSGRKGKSINEEIGQEEREDKEHLQASEP